MPIKKKILLYYYYEEITIDSTTSVTRLAASLLQGLRDEYDCFILCYDQAGGIYPEEVNRITVRVPAIKRLLRKINNMIGLPRMHRVRLKRAAAKQTLKGAGHVFDAVIVPGLDDMAEVRSLYPAAKLLYWIHNISAICKPQYLSLMRYADHFVTPSRSAYQLLLQKMQPVPLPATYYFMPNWCEPVFYEDRAQRAKSLRVQYGISESALVFIFSGGDHPVKGRKLLEKILLKLSSTQAGELVFIFAGSRQAFSKNMAGNTMVLQVGLLSAEELSAHYQLSHIGLFPSQGYDHTPLTLLEMSLSGLLPVASDIGGVKEMLGNEYPLLVREPHSPANWLQVIGSVIAMAAAERKAIADRLRARVNNVYNRESAIDIMKTILEE